LVRIHEFDWHITSTKRILETLSQVLDHVDEQLKSSTEEWQLDSAIELAENTLGLAFVCVQVYVTGTIGMLSRLTRPTSPIIKDHSLRAFGVRLANSDVTDIQLCDSMANYYKHHDEWTPSKHKGKEGKTITILRAAGIDETDPYPCVQAGELLFPSEEPKYFERLIEMATGWRQRQLSSLSPSPAPKEPSDRGA
jgi:hypothetical protein